MIPVRSTEQVAARPQPVEGTHCSLAASGAGGGETESDNGRST